MVTRKIHCCGCVKTVKARLTDGGEIYPHRPDLTSLPFWKCDTCGNFVGCHHKTKNRTKPLGCIATQEIKDARKHIHRLLDPIWKSEWMGRKDLYGKLAEKMGVPEYHTAELRTIEESRAAYKAVQEISRSLTGEAK